MDNHGCIAILEFTGDVDMDMKQLNEWKYRQAYWTGFSHGQDMQKAMAEEKKRDEILNAGWNK